LHTYFQKFIAKQISDAKEQKAWKVIKWIPGLNFTYGGIRGIYYKVQGNNKEAMRSLIGSCGGVLGLGAGIAGALVGGPILVPIIVSIVSGSATNQLVTGGGEVLYEVHQNSGMHLTRYNSEVLVRSPSKNYCLGDCTFRTDSDF